MPERTLASLAFSLFYALIARLERGSNEEERESVVIGRRRVPRVKMYRCIDQYDCFIVLRCLDRNSFGNRIAYSRGP